MPTLPTLPIPFIGITGTAAETVINAAFIALAARVTHVQSVAATTWTIPHNLGVLHVSVTVLSATGDHIECNIIYNSVNSVTLTFSQPTSGTAIIKR